MACEEHERLQREYDSALRSWEVFRLPPVVTGIRLNEVSPEERAESLAKRNAAADRLYVHTRGCKICKNSELARPQDKSTGSVPQRKLSDG
jgi:hypothetical protein